MRESTRKTMMALSLAGLLATAGTLTGCTAAARGLGKLTANKYASPNSGTVWIEEVPRLEPPRSDQKTIFIDYRNLSDAYDVELRPILEAAAKAQGWEIVPSDQNPRYRLRADARFFGEVDPESGGEGKARAMGIISGAAVGFGTYAGVREVGGSGAAGAGAGVAAGGLVGLGMTNASQVREWALIVDFVLETYSETPVEFEVEVASGSESGSGGGTSGPRRGDSGSSTRSSATVARVKETSNYIPYGARLSVWANQMNMQENEALPLIEGRIERVVRNMLPQ